MLINICKMHQLPIPSGSQPAALVVQRPKSPSSEQSTAWMDHLPRHYLLSNKKLHKAGIVGLVVVHKHASPEVGDVITF